MPNRAKTFGRLMTYMWRYKGTALMALIFIFLTSAVTTAIPLLARYYIDHFIGGGLVAQGGLILLAYYSLFLVRVAFTFLGNYTLILRQWPICSVPSSLVFSAPWSLWWSLLGPCLVSMCP